MDIKEILINFITRLAGALLGFLVAYLVQKGITLPLPTPEQIDIVAGAIGVVGSGAILKLFKK